MTPEERAEKIYNEYGRKGSWNLFDKRMIDAIAAQIAEAEREARISQSDADHSEAYDEGFAAAKAKAAFLAHQWADNVYNGNGEMQLVKWIRELAAKIEALEP